MNPAQALSSLEKFSKRMPYGVTINNLNGDYLQANQQFCEICEYSEEELLKMSFQDITHPDDVTSNVTLDKKLRSGEIPFYQLSKRYRTKSGKTKHVLLQVTIVRDVNNVPAFYYAQIVDITGLTHLIDENHIGELRCEAEFPLLQQNSSAAYEALSLYGLQNMRKVNHLSHIAHELKNPLNSVVGFGNLMKTFYEKGDLQKANEISQRFKDGCDRLEYLVNELLDLSYLESGQLELDVSEFDIVLLVDNVVKSMQPMSTEQGIEIEFKHSFESPIKFTSDKARIREIIVNLVSNGIKYTEEGEVTIKLFQNLKGEIELLVQDTGIGIKEENFEAVFDEYKRVHGVMNKEVDSTGLGLPIVKKLVTFLGGKISLESKFGEGSLFRVLLPDLR
ncbi:sensor histidine kinase [Aliikangiella coralliicola]|nr:HAMP domain-containing sensor histidine kinase [Aliikangiella coralliicola]